MGHHSFLRIWKKRLDRSAVRCYNPKAVRAQQCFDDKRWCNSHPYELVLIAMRVHLFPSRTQKLSSCAPTILGGRLPGKIGNANIFYPTTKVVGIFITGSGTDGPVHLFPVAVPCVRLADGAAALHADRCHSLWSLYPPPAALPSLPIPNTEVKLMYADNTWRATAREDR